MTTASDFVVSLEPLLAESASANLKGMVFVLDKSRTGSCRSLSNEQLRELIVRHGGDTAIMFTPEVTHVFSDSPKAPLAQSATVPVINSNQLGGLISPAYVAREQKRHEEELAKERELKAAEDAQKLAQTKQQVAPVKRKAKRTYSATLIKQESMEQESSRQESDGKDSNHQAQDDGPGNRDEDSKEEGFVKRVAKRVAKRRRLQPPSDEEEASRDSDEKQTYVKNEEPRKYSRKKDKSEKKPKKQKTSDSNEREESSDGTSVLATPAHIKRKRFDGKVFFLLGRFEQKQADMASFIQENGGEVASSLTKKVTHLLTANGDDGTITFRQARQRGVKIITEERLNEYMAAARSETRSSSTSTHLLQPTTPLTQRRMQSCLTPLPSADTRSVQMLFDPSPSWKVVHYKKTTKKDRKKRKQEKKERKEKKARRKVEWSDSAEDKENVTPA